MSTNIQNVRHPFVSLWLNFCGFGRTHAKAQVITVDELIALPVQSQLLIYHSLEINNPIVELLSHDADVSAILSAGWVERISSPTVGIACFKFSPAAWKQLKLFQGNLRHRLSEELMPYRRRKSVSYPWNWW